jgi:hypothetical protein
MGRSPRTQNPSRIVIPETTKRLADMAASAASTWWRKLLDG